MFLTIVYSHLSNVCDIIVRLCIHCAISTLQVPGEIDFGPYLEENPFERLQSDMFEM